jgi:hypothetical protein
VTASCRKGRAHGTKIQVRPTDLSDVLDLTDPRQVAETGSQLGVQRCAALGTDVYSFHNRPGMYRMY